MAPSAEKQSPLLQPDMAEQEVRSIPVLALAHVGDGVYDLMVRTMLLTRGDLQTAGLHRKTTEIVCAPAQAAAAEKLLPLLTEAERDIYRRGRNANVHSIPKNATHAQYSRATGLEALFGALWLMGRRQRLEELFALILEEDYAP